MGESSIVKKIKSDLWAVSDAKYRDFQAKLLPTVSADRIIGVRTPRLRKMAKEILREYVSFSESGGKKQDFSEVSDFLNDPPHEYFEENQLHAFMISEVKDFEQALSLVDEFLPHVDNWATCDQMSVKVFKKNRGELIGHVRKWIQGESSAQIGPHAEPGSAEYSSASSTYIIRYGIVTLMNLFLDDDFKPEYLDWVAEVESDEYYVNMARAWFFATALAKQYDDAFRILKSNRLDVWTHNRTIQKAIESYRVSDEVKRILRGMKR